MSSKMFLTDSQKPVVCEWDELRKASSVWDKLRKASSVWDVSILYFSTSAAHAPAHALIVINAIVLRCWLLLATVP